MKPSVIQKQADFIIHHQIKCMALASSILKKYQQLYSTQGVKYSRDQIEIDYKKILKSEAALINSMYAISDSLEKLELAFKVEWPEEVADQQFISAIKEHVGFEARYAYSFIELFKECKLEDVCPKKAMKLILAHLTEFLVISDDERKGVS